MDITGMQQELEILAGATPADWPSFYEELKHFLHYAWMAGATDDELHLLKLPSVSSPETDGDAVDFWKRWRALGADGPKVTVMIRDPHGERSQRVDVLPSAVPSGTMTVARNGSYCDGTVYTLLHSNCQRLLGRQDTTYRILSGFPGVGKTHLASTAVLDSDSSKFPKDGFPDNYLKYIHTTLHNHPVGMMVSSHAAIRQALAEDRPPYIYILAYPSLDCKDEYLQRYIERNSPQAFVDLLEANWTDWVRDCAEQTGCLHVVLRPGQHLSDAVAFNLSTSGFVITQT